MLPTASLFRPVARDVDEGADCIWPFGTALHFNLVGLVKTLGSKLHAARQFLSKFNRTDTRLRGSFKANGTDPVSADSSA